MFAATVHNTVNGELAIALGLGGVSETIVSGRTAGLEALILGARRVAAGDADRILVVAAEGVDDAMRDAWEEERSAFGEGAAGVDLVESAAAVLLEAEGISSKERDARALRLRLAFIRAGCAAGCGAFLRMAEEGGRVGGRRSHASSGCSLWTAV